MKICTKCKVEKDLELFTKDKRRSDGRGSWCRECSNSYLNEYNKTPKGQQARRDHWGRVREAVIPKNRERYHARKALYKPSKERWATENRELVLDYYRDRGDSHRAFLDGLKEGSPCTDCKGDFPPYCMEYDHVRGEKRFNLGKMANHKREAVLAEIQKCDLVCVNCHRVRTQTRKGSSKTRRVIEFRAWLNTIKDHPCLDCGRKFPPVAMDFDHIQGEKISSITDMWSWSREKAQAEIAKCELVCGNCHRIRTIARLRAQRKAA